MSESHPSGDRGAPKEVPEEEWDAALSRFAEAHHRSRVSVEIQEPDGGRRPVASEADVELSLLELASEERDGGRTVRLSLHQHPGAEICTVEMHDPVQILQGNGSCSVETAEGRRVRIQRIPPEPDPS